MQEHKEGIPLQVMISKEPLEACENADAVVLLTDWAEYETLDPNKVIKCMAEPNLIDTRNVFDPKEWEDRGFTYQGIGR